MHQLIRSRFPEDEVFQDIRTLRGGEKWGNQIDDALAHCSVVIAVVGPAWLTVERDGRPRLQDPDDRLRRELEAGLRRGVPMIPLLVGDATTPAKDALPETLQPLVDWEIVRFSDRNSTEDFERLADAIHHALETEPGELALGSTFGAYTIEAYLGRGGMGIVYSGENRGLGRMDAVKVIKPVLSHDREFRARFAGESRLAASVRHPNVLTVYTAGEENGLLYLAMQLVNGPDLARIIREQGPLPPARAAAILGDVASALQAAHDVGLIHRDVKPGNVLVDTVGGRDHVYLSDFGLARETTTDTGLSTTGRWLGTADYVSPEQVMGEPVDGRADIYALGCVLFEALTGRVPYPTTSETAKLVAHATKTAPPLLEIDPAQPPAMAEVVRTAMARDPDARYATASEFREALLAAAKTPAQRPPVEKPKVDEEPPEQVAQTKLAVAEAKKSRRRIARKVAAIAGGLLLIAAAAGGAGFALSSGGGSLAQTVTHLGGVNNDVAVGNDGIVADGTPDGTPEVLTVDPSTRKVVRTVDLPASFQPGPLAVGGGKTWVIDVERGDLAAVGKTGTPDVQHVAKALVDVAWGAGSVWAVDHRNLYRIDPVTLTITSTISIPTDGFAPAPALSLTYGDGSMWVLTSLGEIDAFNAVTTDLVAQKQVGLGQNGCLAGSCITFGAGHVWALNGVVYGIDSASNRVTSASGPPGTNCPGGDNAAGYSIAFGLGYVWTTGGACNADLLRIDPRTHVGQGVCRS